jgi:hypothetical protein
MVFIGWIFIRWILGGFVENIPGSRKICKEMFVYIPMGILTYITISAYVFFNYFTAIFLVVVSSVEPQQVLNFHF